MNRITPLSLLSTFIVISIMFVATACGGSNDRASTEPAPAAQEAQEPSEENESADEESADESEESSAEDTEAGDSDAGDSATEDSDAGNDSAVIMTLKQEALVTYANIAHASYEDSLELAVALQAAINEFVANPSAETHLAAQNAWLASNEPYGQTEAYRFYGGPIDDEDGPEGLLNAWPLDEAYIDYVDGDDSAGIINNVDEYPTIDKELLISLNEVGAEENISTGYHAIEFLLWGQDQSADTNGQRAYTDYVVDGSGTAANQERRGAYLNAAADLLVENLTEMTSEWAPEQEENYRVEFLEMDPDNALAMVFTGMGVLSKAELAGERMFTAYDNQDQEDEHSCFSDNTHRDIVTNNQGIYNVYFGTYTRVDGSQVSGTSLSDVLEASDATLQAEMATLIESSMALVTEIPVPFDQAIINEESRALVLEAVFALQDQGDKLAQVAGELGLIISTELP